MSVDTVASARDTLHPNQAARESPGQGGGSAGAKATAETMEGNRGEITRYSG